MDRRKVLFLILNFYLLFGGTLAMSRQQLKNSGKILKSICMPQHHVTEEDVGQIEQGKFIEKKKVMCYIACIYRTSQIIKNNKLSYDAVINQVNTMFPSDMKEPVKAAITHCKDVGDKYDDICEASYWSAKCTYDYDPKNFVFP